ncbi:SIS domain-containing protein [Arthrobacter sp. KN11-1C]|uniref:SIS domain-containing protein n=1 Tax=Arthrobacter sp. KN11-1C TaxID=3445774 RepID=UPI003FA166AB
MNGKTPGEWMLEDMYEQPDRVASALREAGSKADSLAAVLEGADFVVLLGRGSSRSAATYAAEVFRNVAGKPAYLVSPAQLGWGTTATDLRRAAVIAISQSGESREILAAARRALSLGARLIVVTNSPDSELAALVPSDLVVDYRAGVEVAIPATKSFTASLAALLGIAMSSRPGQLSDAIAEIPRRMTQVLHDERARFTTLASGFVLAGEGFAEAVAEEGAIKLRETLLLPASVFEASEFLHGSINSASATTTVVAIAADSVGAHLAAQVVEGGLARGATTVYIGSNPPPIGGQVVTIPEVVPEWVPFLAIIPIQFAARATSLREGLDPDLPSGLSKITRIENSNHVPG